MDFDSLQDDSAQAAPPSAPAATPAPQSQPDPASPLDFDSMQDDAAPKENGFFDNAVDTAKSAEEGLERGLTFGASDYMRTKVEPKLTGDSPEVVQQGLREDKEQHPIAEGIGNTLGSAASLFGTEGLGEAGLGLKTGIAGLGKYAKFGANALKAGLEGIAVQGGNEVSKDLLGQGDNSAAGPSALTNMGIAGLLSATAGGVFGLAGSGLAKLADTGVGRRMAQAAEEFGGRLSNRLSTPDVAAAVTEEMTNHDAQINNLVDDVRGYSGLKSQAIDKLSQDIDPQQVVKHVGNVSSVLDGVPDALKNDPQFQDAMNAWKQKVTTVKDPFTKQVQYQATPGEVFKATDALKRQMQEWGNYNAKMVPLSEQPFRNGAQGLASKLRESLENTSTWGDLGSLQAGVNKATTKFIPFQKAYNSGFLKKGLGEAGELGTSEGKYATYVKQIGTPAGKDKATVLKNYIGAGEDFRDEVSKLHEVLGIDSPIEPSSLDQTKATYDPKFQSGGAKLADWWMDHAPKKIGTAALETGGATMGGITGLIAGRELAQHMGAAVGRPVSKYGALALLKVMGTGAYKSTAQALEHANNVSGGAQLINNAMESLFKAGSSRVADDSVSDGVREKVKKFVHQGGANQQLQDSVLKQNAQGPQQAQPQAFAEGGEIKDVPPMEQPAPEQDPQGPLGSVYPEHTMMLQAAKTRISNYLNTLKPQEDAQPMRPFDPKPDHKMQEKAYNNALDMAIKPLSILNSVKDGSITIGDMKHFTQMYPELHSHLSKEMTKRVLQQQMDGEKPNHRTRQGMSMFLGSALDTSLTPQGIMAAQGVFAAQKANNQAQAPKTKKGTSKLGETAKQFQTPEQAAQERQTQER